MRVVRWITVNYPEALKYSRLWTYKELSNGVRVSLLDSKSNLAAVGLLIETGAQENLIGLCREKLRNYQKYPGVDFHILRDRVEVTVNSLPDDSEKVLDSLISHLSTPQKPLKSSKPSFTEDTIIELLYKSCFDSPKSSDTLTLLSGNNLIVSATGLSEPSLYSLSSFPPSTPTKPSSSTYKPLLQIINSPIEETVLYIAYSAPPLTSSDFFTFKFLQNLMTTDKFPYYDQSQQFSYLNSLLFSIPGVYSHSVTYEANKDSGLFIHKIKAHSMAVTFAGSAVIRSMKRATKQVIPKEIERVQMKAFNDMLEEKSKVELCRARNEAVWARRFKDEFAEFLVNLNENFICSRVSAWVDSHFPSIVVLGKTESENVIEGMFEI